MPVMSVSSRAVGPAAAAVIVVLALPAAMPGPDALAQDVPELLAAVDNVVFDDADCEVAVDEPRLVVPRAAVPRLDVPRPAIPCTTISGEEFGAAAGGEFAAGLVAGAVADVDVEAALALVVVVIPDVLTDGQGTCMLLAVVDAAGGRPLIVVPTDSVNPPPSKVGNTVVAGFPVVHGAGLGVPE
jgi:hypothetical protein